MNIKKQTDIPKICSFFALRFNRILDAARLHYEFTRFCTNPSSDRMAQVSSVNQITFMLPFARKSSRKTLLLYKFKGKI